MNSVHSSIFASSTTASEPTTMLPTTNFASTTLSSTAMPSSMVSTSTAHLTAATSNNLSTISIISTTTPSIESTTTTLSSTRTTTSELAYYPCRSNIVILLDASNGLTADEYAKLTNFVNSTLVTDQWTNFQRIGLAWYAGAGQFIPYTFGLIQNYINFKILLGYGLYYYGNGSTPSISG
jgi:hypothetical protein